MSYDNPTTITYELLGKTLSTAATLGRLTAPVGKTTGKVRAIAYSITTATTTAATVISVGITGTLGKYATAEVPVATADNAGSGAVTQVANIASGASVLVSTGGQSGAGVADIFVTVDWF